VKVYLLLVNDEEFFFYSDDSEADESREDDPAPPSGVLGGLQERWHRFQKAFHEADAGVARWTRRSWDWLHSLTRPDESMLVRLRTTRRIDLDHPASRNGADVARIWHDYLARRWRAHAVCLSYNALIAPLALALLWPLPGPNLIGYWFAYRAVHHWLILRGIQSVRKGRIVTHYHADTTLDQPVKRDPEGRARHAAVNANGDRLADYLNFASSSCTDKKDATHRGQP
jgi:Mitochondrial K+-H+ exchange-related